MFLMMFLTRTSSTFFDLLEEVSLEIILFWGDRAVLHIFFDICRSNSITVYRMYIEHWLAPSTFTLKVYPQSPIYLWIFLTGRNGTEEISRCRIRAWPKDKSAMGFDRSFSCTKRMDQREMLGTLGYPHVPVPNIYGLYRAIWIYRKQLVG